MTNPVSVLLVDDDEDLLKLMKMRLEINGVRVTAVASGEEAITDLGIRCPDVVVTDLRMPGMSGMDLFYWIRERQLHLPVIVLTAHGTIPDAVEAVQRGVFSYLVKPFDAERLLEAVTRAAALSAGRTASGDEHEEWRSSIISCSPTMENVLQRALRAARTDISILIQCETGTGKELLAEAIHKASERSGNTFMTMNCAAIPEALLESELFGHAAGAFTGADRRYEGLFQAADGGTVFLDEIGDMPLSAQAKLLRVLERGDVRPVGSTETVHVNVRILSATHQPLAEKVDRGEFREDLFYRLNVVSLSLPPLAERREDIPLLVQHFTEMLSRRHDCPARHVSPDAMEVLVAAPWPGNVRQLLNVVEQCVVLSPGQLIGKSEVESALRSGPEQGLLSFSEARQRFEHEYLVRLLNLAKGNIALAARLADRNRSEFYKLLRRHGLEPARFRPDSDDSALPQDDAEK